MNASYKNAAHESEKSMSDAAERMADKAVDGGKAAMRMGEDAVTSVKRKFDDVSDQARDKVEDVKDAASDAMSEGQSRLGAVMAKAQDAKDAIVSGAGSTLSAVRDAAVEKADDARESLSDVGDRLAQTLKRASGDGEDDALKSRVLSSVAHGLSSASDTLRQRSVADLTSDVKTLAKRHPGAFMAAAAVVGFAAARFVRSSAERRVAGRDSDLGQGPRV
jgi:hypothetical protein